MLTISIDFAVFTKCKDSLQDGRRLENLSWRLWFDQSNLARKDDPAQLTGSTITPLCAELTEAAAGLARVQEQGWSEAEAEGETESEWASDTSSDESELDNNSPVASTSNLAPPQITTTNKAPLAVRLSPSQSTSALDRRHPAPPCPPRPLPRDWRSCATINGAGLQRVISGLQTLPPLSAASRAKSAVHLATPRIVTPPPTSRGVSAPEVVKAVKATLHQPLACTKLVNSPAPICTADLAEKLENCTIEPVPATAAVRRLSAKSPPAASVKPLVRSNSTAAHAPIRTTSIKGHIRRHSSNLQNHTTPAPTAIVGSNADAAARVRAATAAKLGITPSHPVERSASTASFEPKSLVKGFDTSVFEARPGPGSIAPPPTPAQNTAAPLLPSPPSAMKVPGLKPNTAQKKKLFFISSPNSDSEDDHSSSRSRDRKSSVGVGSSLPRRMQPSPAKRVLPPQVTAPTPAKPTAAASAADDEEWDDDESEEDDDEDASSGWGSDYSTENETSRAVGRSAPAAPVFEKRPSTSELKPRGPGLLSQLFHPDMFVDDRSQSDPSLARHRSMLTMATNSKSVAHMPRTKSYLRGKPDDVELETSSDEDDDEDEYESSPDDNHAVASALARHQRAQYEAQGPIAPPQTPRTTRRAMLATELSESLRRNLLWERQTRNRHLGPQIAPQLPPAHQAQLAAQNPADAHPMPKLPTIDGGLMAPHPSPATRDNSPVQPMVRRHTTGTGLYKLAQQKGMGMTKLHSPPSALLRPSPPTVSRPRSLHAPGDESASDSSEDEEEEERPRGYASPAEGVRVW